MKNKGDLILTIGVLMFVISGIIVFVDSINRNIAGLLLVLGVILVGAGSSIKKKN